MSIVFSKLAKILEIQEGNADGNWYTIGRIIYEGQPLENTDTHYKEVFNGCGSCLCDEFLMDIEKEAC